MPGAGAATLAFAEETSYNGGVGGTPTYYLPGTNPVVETAELGRNLQRIQVPGNVEDDDAIAQRVDGQCGVSFIPTSDDYHRLVFNDSYTGFTSGRPQSAEWYLGTDLLSGSTVERQVQGWIPQTAAINYNGATESVRASIAGPYAEEDKNTSITPGTINNDSTGNEVPGHGATLKFGGTKVSKLQSATIQIQDISRRHFGSVDPIATDAAMGNVNESVSMTGVFEGATWLEYAYGSSGASSVEDFVDSISCTLTLDHDGSTIADYTFDAVKPRNYNWQDLINNDADLTEPVEWWATGITASDPTA